ncbi:unnamed protein product [Closterium sp. NIES-65]|nr:unnamed protein product [Closterium sp. NIES-65]
MVLVKRALVRQLVAEAGARMNVACKDPWDGCADRGGSDQVGTEGWERWARQGRRSHSPGAHILPPLPSLTHHSQHLSHPLSSSPCSPSPSPTPILPPSPRPPLPPSPPPFFSDAPPFAMPSTAASSTAVPTVCRPTFSPACSSSRSAETLLVASMAIITTTTSIAPPFSSARAAGGSDRMGAWASPAELRAWAGSPDRWLKVSCTSPCRASCPPRARPSPPLRPPYKLLHCRHHITMGQRHTVATCAGMRKPTLPAHVSGHAEHAVRLHAWGKGEASRGRPAVSRPSGQEGGGGDNVQAEQVGHEGNGDGEADGKGGWAGGWVREEGKVGGEGEQEGGGEGDRQVTKADGKGSGEEGEERVGYDERRGSGEGHGGEAVRR